MVTDGTVGNHYLNNDVCCCFYAAKWVMVTDGTLTPTINELVNLFRVNATIATCQRILNALPLYYADYGCI